VLVKPGDKLAIGAPVLRLSGDGKPAAPKKEPASGGRQPPVTDTKPTAAPKQQGADAPRSPQPSAGAKVEFRLPALGEGIDAATVTAVLVKAGDAVKAGQPVLSVETDKAAMEVETDAAGTVEQVHVKPGDKLPIGQLVLTLSGAAAPASGGRQPPEKTTTPESPAAPADSSRPPLAQTK